MGIGAISNIAPLVFPVFFGPGTPVNPMETAKAHFKAGRKYFERGEYESALTEFRKSYGLFQRHSSLYNIGICYEKLGQLEKAIATYQSYLQAHPNESYRKEAEERITQLLTKQKLQQERAQPQNKPQPPGNVTPISPPDLVNPIIDIAKAHFQTAELYYNRGEYALAIKEWKECYALSKEADILFNIAKSYEKLGKLIQAMSAYQDYLSLHPGAKDYKVVEAKIAELAKKLPPPPPPPPPPKPIESKPLTKKPVRFSPQPIVTIGDEPPPPPPPPPKRKLNNRSAWIFGGLSAASFALGLVGHFKAESGQKEYDNKVGDLEAGGKVKIVSGHPEFTSPSAEQQYGDKLDDLENKVNTYGTLEAVGFGGMIVFLGLGGFFYWWDNKNTNLVVAPTTTGGQVGFEVRF